MREISPALCHYSPDLCVCYVWVLHGVTLSPEAVCASPANRLIDSNLFILTSTDYSNTEYRLIQIYSVQSVCNFIIDDSRIGHGSQRQ